MKLFNWVMYKNTQDGLKFVNDARDVEWNEEEEDVGEKSCQ